MPRRCSPYNETSSQKIVLDRMRSHLGLKSPSSSQLAAIMICGMLVGTVPNIIPAARPTKAVRKI